MDAWRRRAIGSADPEEWAAGVRRAELQRHVRVAADAVDRLPRPRAARAAVVRVVVEWCRRLLPEDDDDLVLVTAATAAWMLRGGDARLAQLLRRARVAACIAVQFEVGVTLAPAAAAVRLEEVLDGVVAMPSPHGFPGREAAIDAALRVRLARRAARWMAVAPSFDRAFAVRLEQGLGGHAPRGVVAELVAAVDRRCRWR